MSTSLSQPDFCGSMGPAPTTSSRPVYGPNLGTSQHSYPPPPPPSQQNFRPGQQYARPIAPSYAGSSSITPSAEQQSDECECTYCGKRFSRAFSLTIHVLSHTNDRPFKCTFEGCNRTFSVQSHMRRHARIHMQPGNEPHESEEELDGEVHPDMRHHKVDTVM